MKKKMKFPDGSVREIDEADVATARSLGAVDFTETVAPSKSISSKKVFMQFGNETREIDETDVAVAESMGGVKKKDLSANGVAINSGALPQFGYKDIPINRGLNNLVQQPEVSSIFDYWNEEIKSGDKARVDKAKKDITTFRARGNPSVITTEDRDEIARLTTVTDPATQLEILETKTGYINRGQTADNMVGLRSPMINVDWDNLPMNKESAEKLKVYAEKLQRSLSQKKDTQWSNKNVVSLGGKETNELEEFLKIANPVGGTIVRSFFPDGRKFNPETLNDSFSTGLESWNGTYRQKDYDRIKKRLLNNEPISTTDIVEATAVGAKILDTINAQDIVDEKITPEQYAQNQIALGKEVYENVYKHPDYLRSLISGIISEHYEKDGGGNFPTPSLLGLAANSRAVFSKWMVTDKEIDAVPMQKYIDAGLDPNNPEFKKQLSLIKEKEGWMPFQNAIAKDDLFREFKKGVLSVPQGLASTTESLVTSDDILKLNQETQQFNVTETANRRGKYFEENYGTWADAFQGLGQFSAQLALMYAGSSAIGGAGAGIGGGTTASQLMGATRLQRLGNLLTNSKDLYATYGVPFVMSYGDYYKDALTKGANPLQAKMMAFTNASMEGVSETMFDNLAFGRQVAKDLFNKPNFDKIAKIFDRGVLDETAQKEYKEMLQGVIKGVGKSALATSKESFEEVPVALTNFIVDAAIDPANVKDRNVAIEMKDAFLDGLVSFSIPSLVGLGGNLRQQFKEQKPAQESLMIAAMQQPFVKEAIDNLVAKGELTQEQANQKIQVLNTAAEQLQQIPKTYTDGTELSPQDREAYLSLSVKEKYLDETVKKGDGAQQNIAKPQIEEITKLKEDILNKNPIEEEREGDNLTVELTVETNQKELTPEEKIVELVNNGVVLGGAEMAVKADPSQATEALRFIAQQAYGITETGEPASGGIAEIENKEALAAAKERFPTPESTLEKVEPIIPKSNEEIETLEENKKLDNKLYDDRIKNLSQEPAATFEVRKENIEKERKESNDYYDSRINQLKTQTPKEQLPEVEQGKVAKIRITAAQAEERSPENIRQRYIEDFNIVEDSKFDWRVTSQLSTQERKKAVEDINAGKNTAVAKKLEQEIKETIDRGTVIINRGRGDNAETVEIPVNQWFQFTPIEQDKAVKAAETASDETISIIQNNDITLDNIDSLKDLFNGFPYDETDFNNVKNSLQGEATRNAETTSSSQESQPVSEEVTAPAEKPRIKSQGNVAKIPVPPSRNEGGDFEVSGEDITGITHAQTETTRDRFQLPSYDKSPETVAEWDAEADRLIFSGYDIPNLLNQMENGYPPTAVEQRIMLKYIATLEAKVEKTPSDENLAELHRAIQISDRIGGSEIGKSLVARKGNTYRDDSLASFFIREMEENEVDVLTPEQKSKVQKEYNDIKAANEALNQKIQALEEENSRLKAGEVISKERKRERKGKKTTEEFKKERQKITESIKEKLAKARTETSATIIPYAKELIAISPDVAKLVKSYVEEGVTKLGDVVDGIHEILKEDIKDLTKKDVLDLIAGEYREPKKTKNELAAIVRDLKTEAGLINQLQKLEEGEVPITEKKIIKRNKEIAALRQQIQSHDLTKLADTKKRIETQIDKIQKQLDTGDFAPPEKKQPIKLDREGIQLQDNLIKLKQEREIRILRERYQNRSTRDKAIDKVLEVANVPRSIMASMDYSAPLRQAIIATLSHPILAAKAAKEMFISSFSQKNFDRWFFDLKNDPRYDLMVESKLAVTDPHSPFLSAKEEVFMNNMAEKIPIVGKLIKGSERAYVQYLNKMRVDLFNMYADRFEGQGKTFENSEELYTKMAGFINNMTGRGNIGKLEEYAPVLNTIFFSPRLIASRLNLLNPYYFAKLPKELKKEYAKDMLRFVGLGLSVLALISFAGSGDDDEDKIRVETDARSSDFMKLRQGNTRWDIWGGFQPYVRLIAQMFSGQSKSTNTGKIYNLDGEGAFGKDRVDVLKSFFRNKLAPVPSGTLNVLSGRNSVGEEVTLGSQLKESLLPINYTGLKDAINDQGIKAIFTVGIPSTFGVSTQTYSPKKTKK